MSNYFHPGVTRHMAEKLVEEIMSEDYSVSDGSFGACAGLHLRSKDLASKIEGVLNRHACSAAGIMGNDPSSIYRSVWYRSDGWGHGGSAITWRDHSEELEAELVAKNALIDRAKPLLEEYFSELDCSGETSSRAANEITKLLTDIEHL